MKSILFIVAFLTVLNVTVSGQESRDTLLTRLNNQEVITACLNTQESLYTYSREALDLIRGGKQSTRRLVSLLTDPERGIIAHYILVRIWLDKKFTPIKRIRFEEDRTLVFEYYGLVMRQKDGRDIRANLTDLENNKRLWLDRLPRRFR
jgi:hypothetical protein